MAVGLNSYVGSGGPAVQDTEAAANNERAAGRTHGQGLHAPWFALVSRIDVLATIGLIRFGGQVDYAVWWDRVGDRGWERPTPCSGQAARLSSGQAPSRHGAAPERAAKTREHSLEQMREALELRFGAAGDSAWDQGSERRAFTT